MEAHRLRYMEDLTNQEIADRLGVSLDTVKHYFSDNDNDKYKRFYSDQELFQLQQSLEQDINDGERLANNLLARAIQHEDATPNTLVRASKQALAIREKKVKLLQELGIIQKPAERKEIQETKGTDEVLSRLQSAYQELQEQEEEGGVERSVET